MKAHELIELLKAMPPDTYVFAWADGDRREILEVDQWDDFHADLNLKEA
jgi:hypothetical protein